MDKILEMLGINKLDEEDQEKLKEKLDTIIEAKAVEVANGEMKEKMVEEMETKFEAYKEDVTSKFSNFLDDILEEELVLPENVMEYARIGEEYAPLIESFKAKLAIDEGILDDEIKDILKEARDEIITITEEKDEFTSKNLDLELNNEQLTNENYLLKKCDGLTLEQKKKVTSVLEGASKEEIDKKFDVIVSLNEKDDKFATKECPECGAENKKDAKECKECGAKFEEQDDDGDYDKNNDKKKVKKESITDTKDKKSLNENSPKSIWLKVLKEGRI